MYEWFMGLPSYSQEGILLGIVGLMVIIGLWYADKRERRRIVRDRISL